MDAHKGLSTPVVNYVLRELTADEVYHLFHALLSDLYVPDSERRYELMRDVLTMCLARIPYLR